MTPTCAYLANRGLKAANVLMVAGIPLPEELDGITRPVMVGLNPRTQSEIRQNHPKLMNEDENRGLRPSRSGNRGGR